MLKTECACPGVCGSGGGGRGEGEGGSSDSHYHGSSSKIRITGLAIISVYACVVAGVCYYNNIDEHSDILDLLFQ